MPVIHVEEGGQLSKEKGLWVVSSSRNRNLSVDTLDMDVEVEHSLRALGFNLVAERKWCRSNTEGCQLD